jgi:hypothetical protein
MDVVKHLRYSAVLLLFVALLASGCAFDRETHTSAGEPIVPQTLRPLTIDGVLDEAEWANAAVIGPFVGPFAPAVPSAGATDLATNPEFRTEARVLWDPTHLYIAFTCRGGDARSDRTKHNEELNKQDVAEAFIDVVGDMSGYAELQANPVGATGTYLHAWDHPPTYQANNIDWAQAKNDHVDAHWMLEGFVVASKAIVVSGKTEGWICEWSVPMSAVLAARGLAVRLHEGQTINANFLRYEYPATSLDGKGQRVLHQLNWSPTVQGCPHVSPMAMKRFVLGTR